MPVFSYVNYARNLLDMNSHSVNLGASAKLPDEEAISKSPSALLHYVVHLFSFAALCHDPPDCQLLFHSSEPDAFPACSGITDR